MKRIILAVVVALLLTGRATYLVAAGHQPINGCNAAPSCRASGFSVLTGSAGGHVLMSFGVAWDPGVHLGLVPRPSPPSAAEENGDHRFHLHTPALATPLLAAPGLTPPAPDSE